MGFLGDVLGFEAFNAKDMFGKIKKDPWRLAVGAGDPLSTKMWSGITGHKMEPLVDQMGGAYGGHTISAFGNNDGGVYGRAKEAGINTGPGGMMHDAAHVVASIYGGQGLMNAGQGFMGSMPQFGGADSSLGVFANGGQGGLSGVGGGNAGALAARGGISGGAGMGSATAATPMGTQDYLKLGQQMMGGQQQQPEQEGPKPYLYRGRVVWM